MLVYQLAGTPPQFSLRPYIMGSNIQILAPFITLTIGQVLANETRGLSRGSPRSNFQ